MHGYMRHTPPLPPRPQHAALLVHGLAGSPQEMRSLTKRLEEEGYAVHAPLLPGHGTSPRDLARTTWQDWYQPVREVFLQLASQYRTVSVAGLCMGSLLALK